MVVTYAGIFTDSLLHSPLPLPSINNKLKLNQFSKRYDNLSHRVLTGRWHYSVEVRSTMCVGLFSDKDIGLISGLKIHILMML